MKERKNVVGIFVLCIATIICIAFGFYAKDTIKTSTELKTVEVSVINREDCKIFNISTTGETLHDALDEISLADGEDGAYGLYVKTVNGYTVNEENEEWWCITKAGEAVFEGIDSIRISDGDKYEITLKTGY